MKKIVIITAIAVFLLVIVFVLYAQYVKAKNADKDSEIIKSQADLIRAQALAEQECKDNWLCATNKVLGGVTGIIDGIF